MYSQLQSGDEMWTYSDPLLHQPEAGDLGDKRSYRVWLMISLMMAGAAGVYSGQRGMPMDSEAVSHHRGWWAGHLKVDQSSLARLEEGSLQALVLFLASYRKLAFRCRWSHVPSIQRWSMITVTSSSLRCLPPLSEIRVKLTLDSSSFPGSIGNMSIRIYSLSKGASPIVYSTLKPPRDLGSTVRSSLAGFSAWRSCISLIHLPNSVILNCSQNTTSYVYDRGSSHTRWRALSNSIIQWPCYMGLGSHVVWCPDSAVIYKGSFLLLRVHWLISNLNRRTLRLVYVFVSPWHFFFDNRKYGRFGMSLPILPHSFHAV